MVINVTPDQQLVSNRFPRSSRYNPEWVIVSASGSAHSLWMTEWLSAALDLRPGMRVLDLGCGRASSSIFLRREFGVEVWATDLWFSASENAQRIRDAGVADGVFPIHADARSLPFANFSMPSFVLLVPAFGLLVATALGENGHSKHRTVRHHARSLATVAVLAPLGGP